MSFKLSNFYPLQRRLTWCPGAALSEAPISVQTRLQRIGSSPSTDESEFDELPREDLFSRLDEGEERKSNEFIKRRVAIPQAKG